MDPSYTEYLTPEPDCRHGRTGLQDRILHAPLEFRDQQDVFTHIGHRR